MAATNASKILPTYFLSHGGGPWPWMKDGMRDMFNVLEKSLQEIPRELGVKPKAILIISAHWEERDFTVQGSPNPPMIYDYGGFPEHTYHIHYSAPGLPSLAKRVKELVEGAGFKANIDPDRGYDHGVYAPLYPMYPNADVPVVQLSLRTNLDPKQHIDVGKAIAPLRKEGILILGSGLSYHNLRHFFGSSQGGSASKAFDDWIDTTMRRSSPDERAARLMEWSKAPSARAAHPREDHLIPLMVAVGAAYDEAAERVYHESDFAGNLAVSSYRLGSL